MIVLPCGAGKTVVGIACMAKLTVSTLILTTGVTALRQWKAYLLDKTNLSEDQIGEYSGQEKQIRPVTLSTYQTMTYRPDREGDFPHLALFDRRDWGLIIYDEVHMLPAPVFQVTAGLQARRRLGLTATLVHEDGREEDVFALIGPKKADVPWKDLETQGWIAKARCHEIRLPQPDAAVAIQISETFGSRQEEAQRLGRILRPKSGENQAFFYSLVTGDTVEQEFALNRQLFLCEQGYQYVIEQIRT